MKKAVIFLHILAGILLARTPATGQSRTAILDEYFSLLAKNKNFNGNVLVVEKGSVVYEKQFGFADFSTWRPNAPGTSFSAAYVSGVAALMLERNPALKPNDVRAILEKTARDLGAPGRDESFGAGQADAFAAVTAAAAESAVPMAAVPKPATPANGNDVSVNRALSGSAAALSSENTGISAGNQPAAQ